MLNMFRTTNKRSAVNSCLFWSEYSLDIATRSLTWHHCWPLPNIGVLSTEVQDPIQLVTLALQVQSLIDKQAIKIMYTKMCVIKKAAANIFMHMIW